MMYSICKVYGGIFVAIAELIVVTSFPFFDCVGRGMMAVLASAGHFGEAFIVGLA